MPQNDIGFAGSVPALYDRLLVPLIFAPYAADLAGRLKRLAPATILETAAGTGAVTRAMRAALPDAAITATDLLPPMLAQAQTRPPDGKPVIWQQADALALPFADGSFDCVVCQFGVMFFPDRVKGLREARRVLTRQGHFLFDVWDRIEENHFVAVISDALKAIYGDKAPDFMARVPHGYHDSARIDSDVRAAGFTSVQTTAVSHTARAASAEVVASAYCQGTPLRGEIEQRGTPGLTEVTDIVAGALAKTFGQGPVEGQIRAYVIEASG